MPLHPVDTLHARKKADADANFTYGIQLPPVARQSPETPLAFPKRLPARWLAATAARLTFLSGVGYFAMAYTVSRFLTRARRQRLRRGPEELGLPCEPFTLTTGDGLALSGWLIEPPSPRGTVALFHGMRQNREQMLSRMAFLYEAGYRCVAIDHRAHGESRGKRISFGWYEARDVSAVAKWIAERFPAEPRFALGISMGAAALSFAGPTCGWTKVILEGIYADLTLAFKRRIGACYPRWFGELYPAVMWITQKRLRIRIDQIRPAESIARFGNTPILGIAGERDALAPPSDVYAVFRHVKSTAQLHVVAGAGHNDMCETGDQLYRQRVLDFLEA